MKFALISFFQKMTAFLSITVSLCAVTSCNLFNISVPEFLDKNINTAAGADYRFVSETNGTAGGFHLIKPGQATELDILLRNPKKFDVEPILEFLNDSNTWTRENPLHSVYIAAKNTGDYNRIRVTIGDSGGFPALGTDMPRMRLKLKNRESGRVYEDPYELPLMKCAENSADPENPFMPHIVAAVPTAVDVNSLSKNFQIFWYPGSGGGEIASVIINIGGEERISTDWKNAGAGTPENPYIFDIDMHNAVWADTPLTLTVSYYSDGMSPSAIENPGTVTALPVYVGGGTSYGITSGTPANLSNVFGNVLKRYSNIKIIVSGTITDPGNHTVTENKTIVIEPSADGNAAINKTGTGASLFIVDTDGMLTIQGNDANTLTLGGPSGNNNVPLIAVSGNLIMDDGAIITGNESTATDSTERGGGIRVNSGGIFTMDGGEISGNEASYGGGVYIDTSGIFEMNGGEISINNANGGSGVYISTGGSFEMYDGEIRENEAQSGSSEGGGVFIDTTGTFIMDGGKILGNIAETGGGVYINTTGTFTMEDGEINGNNAQTGSRNGGGVYVGGDFTMNGESIIAENIAANGGGVYINNTGIFIMDGGEISGNIADTGRGIYNSGGTFTQSPGGTITDDTYPPP